MIDADNIQYRVTLSDQLARVEQRDRRVKNGRFRVIASGTGSTPGEALTNAGYNLQALERDVREGSMSNKPSEPPYGVGDRVRLVEEPSVPGTVVALGDDPRWPYEVQWDNGEYNAHGNYELERA